MFGFVPYAVGSGVVVVGGGGGGGKGLEDTTDAKPKARKKNSSTGMRFGIQDMFAKPKRIERDENHQVSPDPNSRGPNKRPGDHKPLPDLFSEKQKSHRTR